MLNKSLTIIVVLLIVGICVPSLTSKLLSIGNIITVDNEGDGDYASIKEAVNNSNPGDIIKVYSGTYLEQKINISIENITLDGVTYELGIGNDSGKPIINNTIFQAEIFGINADGVTISSFIMNNNYSSTKMVTIGQYKDCVISNCDIIHRSYGNCISSHAINNCLIENNTIIAYENNTDGISVFESYTRNTSIINNTISAATGIHIKGSQHIIQGNNINNCTFSGITKWYNANNITIKNNVITNCCFGILYSNSESVNNVICYNEFRENFVGISFGATEKNQVDIFCNNFLSNLKHIRSGIKWSYGRTLRHETVHENYYDNWKGFGSKLIFGIDLIPIFGIFLPGGHIGFILYFPILLFTFDHNPARVPYDIGG